MFPPDFGLSIWGAAVDDLAGRHPLKVLLPSCKGNHIGQRGGSRGRHRGNRTTAEEPHEIKVAIIGRHPNVGNPPRLLE